MAETPPANYLMSFATGGLFYKETLAIAALHKPGGSWTDTAARALEVGAFPVRKESSAKRTIREITHRLRRLSDEECELFLHGDRDEQVALLWLAVCRTYRFIAEFAEEVVVDRYLSFRTHLSYDDFDAFLARKAEWSEQLGRLTDMTRAKLRAVLFRLMREAGVIGPDDQIRGSLFSSRLAALLERDGGRERRFFPVDQQASARANA